MPANGIKEAPRRTSSPDDHSAIVDSAGYCQFQTGVITTNQFVQINDRAVLPQNRTVIEMILAGSRTGPAHDLTLRVDGARAAESVTGERSEISHYPALPEKCMRCLISGQIGCSNNLPRIVDRDCDPVVSSQRAQILHWSRRSPKKRVERQVSRQGGCTHDLAEVIKPKR